MRSRRLFLWFYRFVDDPRLSGVDWLISNGFGAWGLILSSPIILILWIYDSIVLYDAVTVIEQHEAAAKVLAEERRLIDSKNEQQRLDLQRANQQRTERERLARGAPPTRADRIRQLTDEYQYIVKQIREMSGLDEDTQTAFINQKLEELDRRLQAL